jgi:hexulose-6-phosphate isomerase
MYNKIGIMQGRLTKPVGRGIQFFPFDNWEREFYSAKELGLDEIEFIFDYEDYRENPLWTTEGQLRIANLIKDTGVAVNSVCFDYFMRRPFYKAEADDERRILRAENKEFLAKIMDAARIVGFDLIEIPLVDYSSIKTTKEEDLFREFILEILDSAENKIKIGLESDFESKKFLEYLISFHHGRIYANYDSGNSSGLGYNLEEEVNVLNNHIANIHIKDRVFKGKTVALGTGSADFEGFFRAVKNIDYKGSFILQAARDLEGDEEDNIRKQINFIKNYINQL